MLRLYQREECPACAKVRQYLATQHLSVESVFVPRLASQRRDLLDLQGIEKAEVPVLVDQAGNGKNDRVIQGADNIIAYLEEAYAGSRYGDPTYGLTRVLSGIGFDAAVAATKEALASEGFGVLTEIDVKATMRKKLDVDFANYLILGACNPPLAHQALSAEPGIGLLLPCNVVVTEEPDHRIVVSAIDPRQMFKLVNRPGIESVAESVREKLGRVLSKLQT